jgi:(E)-4-hydroxy-3-methylbut-2-enyl-diphosphate synthase
LLLEGIGDTIRVSLTQNPQEEVRVAKAILESLELGNFGPQIISCPTCGRCEVDLVKMVKEFGNKLNTVNCKLSTVNSRPFKVAIMGCIVNGPGEAKEADIGVAFGKKEGILFKHGRAIKKVSHNGCVDILLKELKNEV